VRRSGHCTPKLGVNQTNMAPSIYDVHKEGEWGQVQADTCGWGIGYSPMWVSTQKIKIRVHWRHTVLFSCKEVCVFFTRISSLDQKKWKFFCDI